MYNIIFAPYKLMPIDHLFPSADISWLWVLRRKLFYSLKLQPPAVITVIISIVLPNRPDSFIPIFSYVLVNTWAQGCPKVWMIYFFIFCLMLLVGETITTHPSYITVPILWTISLKGHFHLGGNKVWEGYVKIFTWVYIL